MGNSLKRKSLSILLSLALVLSLFSGIGFTAGAEETALTITGGDTITADGIYIVDGTTQGVITVDAGLRNVTLQGTGTDPTDAIYGISFSLGLDVGLTLEKLYISYPFGNLPMFDFIGQRNAVDFSGVNLLENGGIDNGAIFHVPPGAALDIGTNTLDSALLYIYKNSGGTAIGGNTRETSGTINFNGGTLLIKGSRVGATIGAGDYATGVNEDITINGGNVNITTISQGSGIGGGRGNQGAGNVILNGGNLAMTTDSGGVAIGNNGGVQGSGNLYINGGSLSLFITSNSFNTPATIINSAIYDTNGNLNPVPFVYAPPSLTANTTVSIDGGSTDFYSGIVNQWTFIRAKNVTKDSWSPTGNSSIYLWIPDGTQSVNINGAAAPTPIHDVIFDYDFAQVELRLDQYAPNKRAYVVDPTDLLIEGKGTATPQASADNATLTGTVPNFVLSNIQPGATVHVIPIPGVTVSFSPVNATVYVNDVATSSTDVNSGGSLTFVVVPNAGFRVDKVAADTEVLLPNADGSYTLNNITANVTVTATALADANAWSARADTRWYNVTDKVFTIGAPEQLAGLAQLVNNGTDNFYGKTIILSNNIDLGDFEWTPIGGASEMRVPPARGELALQAYLASGGAYPLPERTELAEDDDIPAEYAVSGEVRSAPTGSYFSGVFDGGGFTVSGLSITRIVPTYGAYGLFGYVNGGTIQNLTVSDSGAASGAGIRTGASAMAVAGIVGYTTGSLYNVTNNARILVHGVNSAETGGVAGAVDSSGTGGNITRSSGAAAYIQFAVNNAAIVGATRLGGVVGAAYCVLNGGVLIDQCYNTGAITAEVGTGRSYVGGIVGYDEGYIQNSYNTGNVASTVVDQHYYVGGIVGILTGAEVPVASLSDSYNTGVITTVYAAIPAQPLYAYADDSSSVTVSNCVYLDSMTQDPLGATVSNVQAVSAAVMGSTTTLPGGLSPAYFYAANPSPVLNWRRGTAGIVGPIYVDPNATGSSPDGTITNPFNNLNDAFRAQSVFRSTIYVVAPLTKASFPSVINMTVDNARIARGNGNTGDMFTLLANESLTFSGGIIEGQPPGPHNVTGSLIYVIGGSFELAGNATLRGNNNDSDSVPTTYGGAIHAADGAVAINGGYIIGNGSAYGAGVGIYPGAAVTMSGGWVGDNDAHYGGGFYISGGTLQITGGVIDSNFSWGGSGIYSAGGTVTFGGSATISGGYAYNSGGIYVAGGNVTMNGGRISSNGTQSSSGGGVYVNAGTFTLSDGNIDNNRATSSGAGVYLTGSGAFNMSGGAITGNTATGASSNGGGVYISSGTTFTMTGGTISNNTAVVNGNGVYVAASNTLTLSPSGTGAISFGEDDAIYLPSGITFNINARLDQGVTGNVPLAFANPQPDAVVAVTPSIAVANNSISKLISGTITFKRVGTNIAIDQLSI